MAEQKGENIRAITDDPIAVRIKDKIIERFGSISPEIVGIPKDIGIFKYKEKNSERIDRLYLVVLKRGDQQVTLIVPAYFPQYNFLGKYFLNSNNMSIFEDIEVDKNLLNQQIEKINEIEQEERQRKPSNQDNQDGNENEGRHITDKIDIVKKNEEKAPTNDNSILNTKKPNLKDFDISLNGALIRLDEVVNGYYLWEILKLEEKLKGRLPDGVDETIFRTGYLTNVNSQELSDKDGRQRNTEDTMVITSFDKQTIIELDENILKPEPKLAKEQQLISEEDSVINADGKETKKPTTTTNTRKTTVFSIPDAAKNAGVAEKWRISVGYNASYIDNGQTPTGGNRKEIYFEQYTLNDTSLDIELNKGAYITKLEDRTKEAIQNPMENQQTQNLAAKSSTEAAVKKREHLQEIIDEIINIIREKYPEFGEHYNLNEIKEKVRELHEAGKSDEEIKDEILNRIKDQLERGKTLYDEIFNNNRKV